MSNGSIWLVDRNLSGAATPEQSESRSNGNEEYPAFPKPPVLLEHNHQTV